MKLQDSLGVEITLQCGFGEAECMDKNTMQVGSNRITNMGKQYEKMNGFRCTGPEF